MSFDGGRTWSTQENQPTAEFYGVTVDSKFPYNLYAAQQDNSTYMLSSVSNPAASILRTGPGCENGSDHSAPEPSEHHLRVVQRAVPVHEHRER